jgi:hypothetical protein
MRILVAIASFLLIVIVLWDAFEAIVLPRRVTRRLRLATFYYPMTWSPGADSRGLSVRINGGR